MSLGTVQSGVDVPVSSGFTAGAKPTIIALDRCTLVGPQTNGRTPVTGKVSILRVRFPQSGKGPASNAQTYAGHLSRDRSI